MTHPDKLAPFDPDMQCLCRRAAETCLRARPPCEEVLAAGWQSSRGHAPTERRRRLTPFHHHQRPLLPRVQILDTAPMQKSRDIFREAQELQVPADFSNMACAWTKAGLSRFMDDPLIARRLLSSFASAMLIGVKVHLHLCPVGLTDEGEEVINSAREYVDDNACPGSSVAAVLSFTRELSTLCIAVGRSERNWLLTSLHSVDLLDMEAGKTLGCAPDSKEWQKIALLRFTEGVFLLVTFEHREQAVFFGMCMHIMSRAARKAPRWSGFAGTCLDVAPLWP